MPRVNENWKRENSPCRVKLTRPAATHKGHYIRRWIRDPADPRIPIRGVTFPSSDGPTSTLFHPPVYRLVSWPSLRCTSSLSLFPVARVYLAVFHSANLNWLFHQRHSSTWYPGYAKNQLRARPDTTCWRDALGLRLFSRESLMTPVTAGWCIVRCAYARASSRNSVIKSAANRDRDSCWLRISGDLSLFFLT